MLLGPSQSDLATAKNDKAQNTTREQTNNWFDAFCL